MRSRTTLYKGNVRPAYSSRVAFVVVLALVAPMVSRAQGQAALADLLPAPGILRNSVTNLHAEGDTLWVGPLLNVTTDGGETWQVSDADSLQDSDLRVYSLDVEGDVVWAGLGYLSQRLEGAFQSAGGFLISEDGGETFIYRFPQLDIPNSPPITYGVSAIEAFEIIAPEESPPFDIDYDPQTGTAWVAGWNSGLRRSDNGGRTWQRVVLPPDDLTEIRPDVLYNFELRPRIGQAGHYNHSVFSVLVDEIGTVWAGTQKGVNRSADGLAWQRFSHDETPGSLVGNWVVSIEEQPLPGRNAVWMATWNSGEIGEQTDDGATVTRDGGETFEQVLAGPRIIDFAFAPGIVYAAGQEDGLFISEDDGQTWRTIVDFEVPLNPDHVVNPNVAVLSVAVTPGAVWAGTDDGLFKSTDGGETWQVFRADVPLHPEMPNASVPNVDTYAYPNPFSPANDRLIRIRYEVEQPGNVDIRIFDFEMRLVRHLVDEHQEAGEREAAWDGLAAGNVDVVNGVYFYAVRTKAGTAWGKILLIE
jgi:hypothetical protein